MRREVKCYENRAANWLLPLLSSQQPQCCGTSGWQQWGRIRERCRNAVKPPWRILGTSPPVPLLWAQSVGSFKEHYLPPFLLQYNPLLLSAPTISIRGLNATGRLRSHPHYSHPSLSDFFSELLTSSHEHAPRGAGCMFSLVLYKKEFFRLFRIILRG